MDVATPKVEIERIKITPKKVPLLRSIKTVPLAARNPARAQASQKSRNEGVNGTGRKEAVPRIRRNECYVMQAEGDFGNSFSSQFSRNEDEAETLEVGREKVGLGESRPQRIMVNTRIDLTRRKTSKLKLMTKNVEI